MNLRNYPGKEVLEEFIPLHEASHAFMAILEEQRIHSFVPFNVEILERDKKYTVRTNGCVNIGAMDGSNLEDIPAQSMFRISLAGPALAPNGIPNILETSAYDSDYKQVADSLQIIALKEYGEQLDKSHVQYVTRKAQQRMHEILQENRFQTSIKSVKEFMTHDFGIEKNASNTNQLIEAQLSNDGIDEGQLQVMRETIRKEIDPCLFFRSRFIEQLKRLFWSKIK